ncbi:MAG: TatD family hydrolase [Patescibacteria group bacterium]
MKLYDTHAHVNLAAFKEDREQIITQALLAGVIINNVGTQKDTSKRAVDLTKNHENVYAVIGLHPVHTISQEIDEEDSHFISREEHFDYEYYKALAEDPKVVGIGECGLDYYRLPEDKTFDEVKTIQKQAFLQQIKLAKELDKALVIHCRTQNGSVDAYEDILEMLKNEKPSRFEIHSFTSNWDMAQRFLELGGYIGLNGIITFDKSGVLKEVIENCPLERIVLETDAPYLAPPPYRGKRNLPEYVRYVAQFIAEVKGLSFEEVCEKTTLNAKTLFKI